MERRVFLQITLSSLAAAALPSQEVLPSRLRLIAPPPRRLVPGLEVEVAIDGVLVGAEPARLALELREGAAVHAQAALPVRDAGRAQLPLPLPDQGLRPGQYHVFARLDAPGQPPQEVLLGGFELVALYFGA
jgi:hypothetical protein